MMTSAMQILVGEGGTHVELPMPSYTYAIIAAVFFTILLMVTVAFREVGASRANNEKQHNKANPGH